MDGVNKARLVYLGSRRCRIIWRGASLSRYHCSAGMRVPLTLPSDKRNIQQTKRRKEMSPSPWVIGRTVWDRDARPGFAVV